MVDITEKINKIDEIIRKSDLSEEEKSYILQALQVIHSQYYQK